MPLGLNRTDLNTTGTSYRNGTPVTLPHDFGNDITEPHDFGNDIPSDGKNVNTVNWVPSPAHFGNIIGGGSGQAIPVLNPAGPTIGAGVVVFMTAAGATDFFWTTDGTTPTYPPTGTTQDYNNVGGPGLFVDATTNWTVKAIAVGPAGTSAVVTQNYTLNAPTVLSITPNHGNVAGGTSAVVIGTGFDFGGNYNSNTIITTAGNPYESAGVVSVTEWDILTGPGSAGTGDVVVTNPDGQTGTLVNGWTYDTPTPFSDIASGEGSHTVTLNTTNATLLVAVIQSFTGPTLSDNKSNSWNYLTQQLGNSVYTIIAYAYAPNVGTGHIFTAGDANGGIEVYALGGPTTTAACFLNQNGGGPFATGGAQIGSVTPVNDGVIVVGMGNSSGGNATINDSFSTPLFNASNLTAWASHLLTTSATPINPTITSSYQFGAVIAAFQGA